MMVAAVKRHSPRLLTGFPAMMQMVVGLAAHRDAQGRTQCSKRSMSRSILHMINDNVG
jgi:hypothetical protein